MFDKKTVDAYQKITAPDDLKEKVLASCLAAKEPEKRNWMKSMRLISSLAACLILAVAFSIFAVKNFGEVSVSVGGRTLMSDPVELSEFNISPALYSVESRVAYRTSVPVEVSITDETQISVSGGMMKICDATTGEKLYTGSEFTAESDVVIDWIVETETNEKQFEMLIDGQKETYILVLSWDDDTGGWTIAGKQTD